MPENPWYMMERNPLLPDDWGDPEGMARRREWLDRVARAFGTLPYAFEVGRRIGPYACRLVYEARSKGDAIRFYRAVNSMSFDLMDVTFHAWRQIPEAFEGSGKIVVDVAPASVQRPPADVIQQFTSFLRERDSRRFAESPVGESDNTGWHDPQEVPCVLGVEPLTGDPIHIRFEESCGHLIVGGPNPDAWGLIDTALVGLALGAQPYTVQLIVGERQDESLQTYRRLPQHVQICTARQALGKGLDELHRRKAALEGFGCGFTLFNWLSKEAPVRYCYDGPMRLVVVAVPDSDALPAEDADFVERAIGTIIGTGARYGVHVAAVRHPLRTYYDDSVSAFCFCPSGPLPEYSFMMTPQLRVDGGMIWTSSHYDQEASSIGVALAPMDEASLKRMEHLHRQRATYESLPWVRDP